MPNWTDNTVIITGSTPILKEIKELLQSEDNVFDFEKILPTPESLNLECGGITSTAMVLAQNKPRSVAYKTAQKSLHLPYTMHPSPKGYAPVLKTENDVIAIGKLYLENQEKYGATTWYDWHCNNWGTKWNSCDEELESESDTELIYRFNTAWSQPDAIIIALSKKYPAVTIKLQSTYEDDMPYNVYVSEFQNGEHTDCGICIDEDMKADYDANSEEEE